MWAHLPANIGFVDIAPVLCAGVTVYKGLKMTDAKPGNWVAISGIGGLGHMAVQYAQAMGFNVAAVDIDDAKLDFARRLGAAVTVNARNTDPAAFLKKELGGVHGVLVTAVSPKAFEQALGMVRRGGTVSLNGLPPGEFPVADLRHGAQRHHRARFHRRYAAGPAGIARFRRRGQGGGDGRGAAPGRH